MYEQYQIEIKFPNRAVFWALLKLLCSYFFFRLRDQNLTSDRGITSRTDRHRFLLAADPSCACQLRVLSGAASIFAWLQLPSPCPGARQHLSALCQLGISSASTTGSERCKQHTYVWCSVWWTPALE